ncbi:MAG: hypothetical protein V2A74_01565 [bacterium]
MSAPTITTIAKMLESLPESVQDRVVEHLREYIEDLRDEQRWDEQFKGSQEHLAAAARRAKKQMADGLAKPMDLDAL